MVGKWTTVINGVAIIPDYGEYGYPLIYFRINEITNVINVITTTMIGSLRFAF